MTDEHIGPQGVQGVEGAAGVQGIQGVQGEPGKPGAVGQDAIATAAAMTAAVQANTKALNRIRRRQFWLWMLLTLTILAVVMGGTALGLSIRAQQTACRSDNALRRGLLNVADSIDRPGQTAEAEAFVVELRRDFALHDCAIFT